MKVSLKLFKDEVQEKLNRVADMLQGIRLHFKERKCVQHLILDQEDLSFIHIRGLVS